MAHGLGDVSGQAASHFQRFCEIRGFFQDGVVGHEVGGSDPGEVGVHVDCCGVGCVAAGGG